MFWHRTTWRTITALLLVVAVGVCPLAAAGDCLAAARHCAARSAGEALSKTHSCCEKRPIATAATPCCCQPAEELARPCLCQPEHPAPATPVPVREAAGESLKWLPSLDGFEELAVGRANYHVTVGRGLLVPAGRPLQALLCIWRI